MVNQSCNLSFPVFTKKRKATLTIFSLSPISGLFLLGGGGRIGESLVWVVQTTLLCVSGLCRAEVPVLAVEVTVLLKPSK